MSKRKILHFAMGLVFTTVLTSSEMSGQELSPAQRELWQAVETCVDNFVNENLEGVLDCLHDDFSGWEYGDTVPRTKSTFAKFSPLDFESTEILALELRPISIRVFGDFAVAHYSSVSAIRGADGKIVRERARWTDVLIRENGRWLWVADHGGVVMPDQP